MSDRFETLKRNSSNLYTVESPVIISEGALLKDSKTDKVIVQLKFQSITEKVIKALLISIDAIDVTDTQLGETVVYQYLDLNIHNGDFFGEKKAILLPDNKTRDFRIKSLTVIFSDEKNKQIEGTSLEPLPVAEQLTDGQDNKEILKQYRIETTPKSKYIPVVANELWMCACGKWNSTTSCTSCTLGLVKAGFFLLCIKISRF